MPSEQEARASERFKHRTHGSVVHAEGSYAAHTLNLSSDGALVAIIDTHSIREHDPVSMAIDVGDEPNLTVNGTVAHRREHYIGIHYEPNDDAEAARIKSFVSTLESQD